MEVDQSHFLKVFPSGENELLMLRSKLMEVNRDNVDATESIDSLYLTYATLLKYGEEMELGLSYKLLSDQIVGISKMLNDVPNSIGKYLGFTLILSIWILKSQDWYNLDDLSSTEICNAIIRIIIDCCDYRGICELDQGEDDPEFLDSDITWIYDWSEHSASCFTSNSSGKEDSCSSTRLNDGSDANLPSFHRAHDYPVNKKRRGAGIVSEDSEEDFKYFVFEMTRANLQSISLLFDYNFGEELFAVLENIRFQDNHQKNTFFNKMLLLNSIICFYRCSGSFLMTALIFKLPRGRHLLESGVEVVAGRLVREILNSYLEGDSSEPFTAEENSIFVIDNISAILWFKTFEAKISIILENKIQEISDESMEVQDVDKEYQKMEILNSHSSLINQILSKFTDLNLDGSNQMEPEMNIFGKVRVKLVETVLGAIYTTFSIPFASRNHFMAYFHIHKFPNTQILELFFNIGFLAQLTTQNCLSELDIVAKILKVYNSTIFLISRFGESSTKQLIIEELSNGLNYSLTPVDLVNQNIRSLLLPDEKIQTGKNPNSFHYSLFKFAYSTLLDIKSIISRLGCDQTGSSPKSLSPNSLGWTGPEAKRPVLLQRVVYQKIASFIYTLNYLNISFGRYLPDYESKKKPVALFIENFFRSSLSLQEIEQINRFVSAEISLYNVEGRFFEQNLGFEINFIKGYLSQFNKNPY
ncbi:hypothetical protein OJ253_2073 [Cryptosporidium canis]|uniref:Uncharacterized protein n=1 Tax=Cryptosporidium canis TaxID=195482 RepID=A0A9D5DK07_9CRYT|nr:hypothetical protein OJ253_2073 [Cryptosporidium canis]